MPNVKYIDNDELQQLIDTNSSQATDPNTVIIDVRGPNEHSREHIAGSINKDVTQLSNCTDYQHKTVIFHCQAGIRTQQAKPLLESLPCQHAYCMQGGLNQWKQCGFTTVINNKAPLELMRQVQIIAGSLVSLGVILGFWLSPYFSLISLFVGLGLLTAGLTGFCGMAKLLMRLPYNRHS